MNNDNFPMLYACFCLLDKMTLGDDCAHAIEEVCAQLHLNHAQQHMLQRAVDVLCGLDPYATTAAALKAFHSPSHHEVHWG